MFFCASGPWSLFVVLVRSLGLATACVCALISCPVLCVCVCVVAHRIAVPSAPCSYVSKFKVRSTLGAAFAVVVARSLLAFSVEGVWCCSCIGVVSVAAHFRFSSFWEPFLLLLSCAHSGVFLPVTDV
jgi:hypothetical protein